MRRRVIRARFLWALLLAAAKVDAAAQRVPLEVPLAPKPGLSAAASLSPLSQTFPLAFSPWTASLARTLERPPIDAVPVPTLRAPKAVPLPAPAVGLFPTTYGSGASDRAMGAASPYGSVAAQKVIDSLREHAPDAAKLLDLEGESGAKALETNFLSAASLGPAGRFLTTSGGGTSSPYGSVVPGVLAARPLLERMLERVRLDDRGRADEGKALQDAITRLLRTPTGRRYAEEFLAEDLTAVVHFSDFPDSQLFLVDGRKRFYAAQAYTDWRQEGFAEVRLNRHYVDGDPESMRESLPSVIGHELLGHGLWYGRAAKANLFLAFHYHELNETLARLVGWAVDYELDGRFEEAGAWSFLQDPSYYLSNLKMRLPYYAVTFGREEMADVMAALHARLAAAKQEVERAQRNLAAQKTWGPVPEHFVRDHAVPERRFELLRREMADLETSSRNELSNAESIVGEVAGLIDRMEAEPGRDSEIYLREAASHPFFARLKRDAERLSAALHVMVAKTPPKPPRAAAARPAEQISREELTSMYHDDVAADAKRANKHWR